MKIKEMTKNKNYRGKFFLAAFACLLFTKGLSAAPNAGDNSASANILQKFNQGVSLQGDENYVSCQ